MKESNEIKEDQLEERQSVDLCKLIDSMNEELNINHNINIQKNLYSDWKNYSKISSNEIEINESIIDATDDESRLPEPPADQTLAQWLAGDDLVDEADNEEQKQINEDDVEINDTTDDCTEESNKSNNNDSFSSQNKNDNLKMNKKRRNSFDNYNDTVDLLTAEMARTGWDVENGNAVTIGELYLLFCKPNKIILEYSLTIEEYKPEPEQPTETAATSNIQPEIVNDKPLTTLQKFLVAANVTLMNFKKTNTNANNQLLNDSSINNNTNKSNRKRNTKNSPVNSQLLSNLIQETILNDENKNDKSTESRKKINVKNKNNNEDKLNSPSSSTNLNQPNKVKCRSTIDDPTKVEEALKELKIRGRHRCPLNKYTYNQNKLFNINGSRPAVLLIRASNLSPVEGKIWLYFKIDYLII